MIVQFFIIEYTLFPLKILDVIDFKYTKKKTKKKYKQPNKELILSNIFKKVFKRAVHHGGTWKCIII